MQIDECRVQNEDKIPNAFFVPHSAFIILHFRYLPSSFTPFLPATVLRGPLRVRALLRVR
jgi:hypothetical protein